MQFVHVCINANARNLDKLFTYILPDELAHLQVGHRVIVPFGRMQQEGFILDKFSNTDRLDIRPEALKSVLDTVDKQAWFSAEMLATARYISRYYLCTLSEALQLFLVGDSGISRDYLYSLIEQAKLEDLDEELRTLADIIAAKHSVSYKQLQTESGLGTRLHKALQELVNRQIAVRSEQVQKKFTEKQQVYLALAAEHESIKLPKQAKKQRQLIEALLELGEVSMPDALLGFSRSVISNMLKAGLIEKRMKRVFRDSYSQVAAARQNALVLNDQQQAVLDAVVSDINSGVSNEYLVHGITGSGKTEIYIQLCKEIIERGQQALILVPEIALTGQIVRRFQEVFRTHVVVSHSRLAQNERVDVYNQMREGRAQILIGARSAVFSPFADLGLILIDEEQEHAYRQDIYPYYHAIEVARFRAASYAIPLVLGSATPSLDSYQRSQSGEMRYFYLNKRAKENSVLPEIELVDMRAELEAKNFSVLSRTLQAELHSTLQAGKQAIILLNRRGFSTFVMCRDCGFVVKCKSCDVSMVYHKNNDNYLSCHYCGQIATAPDICPVCASHRIKFFGTGTQKLEEVLQTDFGQYRVLRMDQDTTRGKFGHEQILKEFAEGRADILVGTQMVAKGHDFPNVTLVGILSADAGLNIPDYRAGESVFSLLTQMAGRAGRGSEAGKVIIQTYNKEAAVMKFVQQQDYFAFAKYELEMRKLFNYPPYGKLLKFRISDKSKDKLELAAKELHAELKNVLKATDVELSEPFYGVVSKVKDVYSMNIICKGKDLSVLKEYCYNNKVYLRKGLLLQVEPVSSV